MHVLKGSVNVLIKFLRGIKLMKTVSYIEKIIKDKINKNYVVLYIYNKRVK